MRNRSWNGHEDFNMTRRHPLVVKLHASLFFIVGLGFPIQSCLHHRIPPGSFQLWMSHLSPLNIAVMTLSFLASYFAWHASRVLVLLLPILIVLLCENNLLVALSEDISVERAWALNSLFALGSVAPAFLAGYRKYLLRPASRVWLQAQRVSVALPVSFQKGPGFKFQATTFDISTNGIFVSCALDKAKALGLQVGETISMELAIGSFFKLPAKGDLIRIENSKGRYPEGMAFKIRLENPRDQKYYRGYITRLMLSKTPS